MLLNLLIILINIYKKLNYYVKIALLLDLVEVFVVHKSGYKCSLFNNQVLI